MKINNLLEEVASRHQRLDLKKFLAAYAIRSSNTQREITKVEVRQQFHEPEYGSYLKFMEGNIQDAVKLIPEERLIERDDYLSDCRRGVFDLRLRFVIRPLTKYLEWEFETYKVSARWGQRICIVDVTQESERTRFADATDMLMFDKEFVLVNWYDDDGVFRGGWDVTDSSLVSRCAALIDELRKICVPLALFEWENKL